jgi:RNA polymerase sigma factor (sigma-70 family)
VVNAMRDHWRQSGRRERRELLATQWHGTDDPLLLDDAVVERTRLVQALRRLPYGQRAVIVLRYWHQLPETEIAEILGNTVGTVKSQASRALSNLRAELQSDLVPAIRESRK